MADSIADLESLYNVEATFEYTSRNGLLQDLSSFFDRAFLDRPLLDHTVLVTAFPPQMFEMESEKTNDLAILLRRKTLYFPDSRILILTMPGLPHEVLTDDISHILRTKVDKMDCAQHLVGIRSTIQQLGDREKMADASWGRAGAGYPTTVVEVGMSESLRQLDRDAQRWIEDGLSHVTQVVTAKIYAHRHEMIFSIWRRNAFQRAEKQDDIHVELRDGRARVRNNKRLRLSFELVFERRRMRGTRQGDIFFSTRELGNMATRVWQEMGLIPLG